MNTALSPTCLLPICKQGDVWQLGKHRLMCGDATSIDDIRALMQQERADLAFSDPPYNINYKGHTADKLKMIGDNLSLLQFIEFLEKLFASHQVAIKNKAGLYVCHGSRYQREFQNSLEANGFVIRNQIIWAKNHFTLSYGRYKFQHEPIFYCHRKGHRDLWYGDKTQSTLWSIAKPIANRLHPTMKPIKLIELAVRNSSKTGDIVLDLCAGSGTTLLACEQTKRQAKLMEIDPYYCDIIIQRWEQMTGQKAVLKS